MRYGTKAAFIFVPEQEAAPDVAITYRELYDRVNEVAALLRGLGLKAGDRVTLHMPMVPELPITMLACARLGVIHSQVFGGFSGQACGSRIQDSGSRILITMDAYWRNGALIDHKVNADIAVRTAQELGQDVDKVLVWQRYPGKYSAKTPLVSGRDFFVNDLLKDYKSKKVDPVALPGEAPLFLMYSSGTTGKPKGAQHGIAGYLSDVTATSKWVLDIHPEDVYWCMADIGWITGHSYIVYGPLASAATSVLYEGVPTFPDAGRPWRIAGRLGVNIFHTAPTAIRMLRKLGPQEPRKYKYHCKSTTTVGEPIEPAAGRGQAADGYYRILGRIDDVINVAGHRLGTKEIESACLTVPEIAEAAVVPVQDEVKGRVPEVYVALKPGVPPTQDVIDRVIKANEEVIGKIARPKHVYIVPDMPKTRSGKIMRRVLAAISNRRDVGDVTTLANPDVVEQIRVMVQGKDATKTQDALPEDIAKFGQI